jgi:predicted aconitase with swiveling domain
MARLNGAAPRGFLFNKMSTKIALGLIVTHAPALSDFDRDPLTVIETGDWVEIDADQGIVKVTKQAEGLLD